MVDSSDVGCSVDVVDTPKRTFEGRKRLREEILPSIDEENSEKIQKIGEIPKENLGNNVDSALRGKHRQLKAVIEKKEEKLRKLKLVRMYRSQTNLDDMDNLIAKWKNVAQEALIDYRDRLNETETKPTLTQIIDHLSIDHKLVDYNADEEDFTS